jgi:hypothetical protein
MNRVWRLRERERERKKERERTALPGVVGFMSRLLDHHYRPSDFSG